ncbi:MAG: TraM recognition domain-containing protein [Syntrophomonas sp.]
MLATLRSRNVHVLIACQAKSDIDQVYTEITARRIINNCRWKSLYGTEDPTDQKYWSEIIGYRTVQNYSTGENSSANTTSIHGSKGKTVSKSETGVPLIRPEELRTLQEYNKKILLAPGCMPVMLRPAYSWEIWGSS